MCIEDILTNILLTYTGLPDFRIYNYDSILSEETLFYRCICIFDDGIHIDFHVTDYDKLDIIADSIHKSYLMQSHEYGMNCK